MNKIEGDQDKPLKVLQSQPLLLPAMLMELSKHEQSNYVLNFSKVLK